MKKISFLLILVSALGFSKLNCMKKRFAGFKSGIKKRVQRPSFLGGKKKPTTSPWPDTSSAVRDILNKPKQSSAPFWKKGKKWGTIEKVDKSVVKEEQAKLISGKRIPGITTPTDAQIDQMSTAQPTPFRKNIMKPVSKMSKEEIEKRKKKENWGTITEEDIAWRGIAKPGTKPRTLEEMGFTKPSTNPTTPTPTAQPKNKTAGLEFDTDKSVRVLGLRKPLTIPKPPNRWSRFKTGVRQKATTFKTQAPIMIRKGAGTLTSPFKAAGRKVGGLQKDPVVGGIAKGFTPKAFWKKKTPIVQPVTSFRPVKPSAQIQAEISKVTQPKPSLMQPSVAPARTTTPAWQAGTIKPQVRPRSGFLTSTPPKLELPEPIDMPIPPLPPGK